MARFSERIGLTGPKPLQIGSMDDALTNRLWNVIQSGLEAVGEEAFRECDFDTLSFNESLQRFVYQIWVEFLAQTRDSLPGFWMVFVSGLQHRFMTAPWFGRYDLLEAIYENLPILTAVMPLTDRMWFADACNKVLEREKSAYRFIGGVLGPITAPEEIEAIEEAQASEDHFKPVSMHMTTALYHLSDKTRPDYRNSIKESITAVETACNIVNGRKRSLGKSLDLIEKNGVLIHPALREAFEKLYEWTNREDGLRHGSLNEPKSAYNHAKFMLVACSAFVNFLKANAPPPANSAK